MQDLLFIYENNLVLIWKKLYEKEKDLLRLLNESLMGTRNMRSINCNKGAEIIEITDCK